MFKKSLITLAGEHLSKLHSRTVDGGIESLPDVEFECKPYEPTPLDAMAETLAYLLLYAKETKAAELRLDLDSGTASLEPPLGAPVFVSPNAAMVVDLCRQLLKELGPIAPRPSSGDHQKEERNHKRPEQLGLPHSRTVEIGAAKSSMRLTFVMASEQKPLCLCVTGFTEPAIETK